MADLVYRSAHGSAALATLYRQHLGAWPVAYDACTVTTGCGDTHVLLAGAADAPPLLLFHGWGETAASLHLQYDLEALAERFRLIMPDTVGQPGQSATTQPETGAAYGAWATDVLDGLGIDMTFAAGSAGGGELALRLAAFAPERVVRAVVIAPTGLNEARPSPAQWGAALALRLRPNTRNARRYVNACGLNTGTSTPARAHYAGLRALVAEHTGPFSPPDALSDAELAAIRAPVLVLLGERDKAVSAQAAAHRASAMLLNGEIEIIEGVAQRLTLDTPGLAEQRMMAFFAALG